MYEIKRLKWSFKRLDEPDTSAVITESHVLVFQNAEKVEFVDIKTKKKL